MAGFAPTAAAIHANRTCRQHLVPARLAALPGSVRADNWVMDGSPLAVVTSSRALPLDTMAGKTITRQNARHR
ncbi:hypothetical protein PtoMrB4_38180 [Metapseudomonas otitidis]|uniref:Uncharacterized protein n=1 Tax=Metapseudomonas otitidis TaxID=319939 RepID=A0A679GFB6_9GAMM|nr:hypothetical protein PtoMrB4_38180 [Pseudomonas otitidis]